MWQMLRARTVAGVERGAAVTKQTRFGNKRGVVFQNTKPLFSANDCISHYD